MSEETPPEPRLPRVKTDEELRQLAIDVYHGHVFCDFMCEDPKMLPMVFMVLALMPADDAKKWFEENEPSMVYEYFDKAGPRSVNGMPGFFSMQFLNAADHEAWADILDRYVKLQEEFTGDGGVDDTGSV